jgi:hypothetical protein
MTCALCKRDEPLLNSHIVLEFLYRPHYDEKHRTLLFDQRNAPSTMLQKGLRERLLCGECEGRLQVYEDYFARYWYKEQPPPDVLEAPEVILTDIDYSRFKLFVLSIAWRASVSQLAPEMSFGPHEEPMRAMLISANAGSMEQYPIRAGGHCRHRHERTLGRRDACAVEDPGEVALGLWDGVRRCGLDSSDVTPPDVAP